MGVSSNEPRGATDDREVNSDEPLRRRDYGAPVIGAGGLAMPTGGAMMRTSVNPGFVQRPGQTPNAALGELLVLV